MSEVLIQFLKYTKSSWEIRRFALSRSLSLLMFYLLVSGCTAEFKDYELDAGSFTAKNIDEIQKDTGLSFPDKSRGLNLYYCGSQIDPSFIARIEIPGVAGESFAKQVAQIPAEVWHFENPLSKKVTWWNPPKATLRIERVFSMKSTGALVHTLLCQEGDRWVCYVFWAHS